MSFGGNHPDELISASLTGDLTDAERAQLDAHLARCERCRATLAAFRSERRILSGLPVAGAPRDLSARVRAGIESGRLGLPWWRRPGSQVPLLASAAVFAGAVLSVVYFGHLLPAPVGQPSGSPQATLSLAPSASAAESQAPSTGPSAPPTFLAAGQLGYFELTGASFEALRLKFVNDATGISHEGGAVSENVSGPVLAASLSPDGEWLAYITQKGETGANDVWVGNLVSGRAAHLGCSSAAPFTDRLVWSPDGRYLAYTLVGIDLGPDSGCETPGKGADVWLFDASTSNAVWAQFTTAGNAFAADFAANSSSGEAQLWVSFAMAQPQSALLTVPSAGTGRETGEQAPGVFLPLVSPEGNRALYWSGTMAQSNGMWQFSLGGMPRLSGDFRSAGPSSPWVGTPLFTDLIPYGGEAFAYGKFTWGQDSDQFAFWDGAWTGVPQSADGTYPRQQDAYVGRVSSGLLSSASRLPLALEPDARIVDVTFTPDGLSVAVTIGLPSAGIGDPPSAYLQIVSLAGGESRSIGGGVNPPPWDGPAVYGR